MAQDQTAARRPKVQYTTRVGGGPKEGAAGDPNAPVYENHAPQLSPLPEGLQTHPGLLFNLNVMAIDQDGDALTYSLLAKPDGMTIGAASGLISWTSGWNQVAAHTITVQVMDPGGLSDVRSGTVTVVNHAPTLQPLNDFDAHPGVTSTFNAMGTDLDGDTLTYSLVSPPANVTINQASGLVTFTPAGNQIGAVTITVRVTDPGGLFDTRSCTANVRNQAPALQPLMDQNTHPGMQVSFTAFAIDPDGDAVVYSFVNQLPNTTINAASGLVTFSPNWNQLGPRVITVRATDPFGLFDTKSCTVNVNNQAPSMNALADRDAHPGVAVTFPVLAIDPDGDALTYTLVSAPPGATLVGTNFSWTPGWNQVNAYIVTVRAADPGNLSDSRSCTITVRNQAPTLMPLMPQSVKVGDTLTFTAMATDLDGDALTFSLLSSPAGATIVANTGVFSWTPAAGQEGDHTVTIQVADPGNLSDVRSCTVTVTP